MHMVYILKSKNVRKMLYVLISDQMGMSNTVEECQDWDTALKLMGKKVKEGFSCEIFKTKPPLPGGF